MEPLSPGHWMPASTDGCAPYPATGSGAFGCGRGLLDCLRPAESQPADMRFGDQVVGIAPAAASTEMEHVLLSATQWCGGDHRDLSHPRGRLRRFAVELAWNDFAGLVSEAWLVAQAVETFIPGNNRTPHLAWNMGGQDAGSVRRNGRTTSDHSMSWTMVVTTRTTTGIRARRHHRHLGGRADCNAKAIAASPAGARARNSWTSCGQQSVRKHSRSG